MYKSYATAQLFLKLRQKIVSLPRLTLEKILTYADSLLFESSLVIEELLDKARVSLPEDLVEVAGLVLRQPKPVLPSRHLSADFSTNLGLLDLEERPLQLDFAALIEQDLEKEGASFIQAPTGMGKTYGYLLPLLAKSSKQLVISLPTKLLQDQIMTQEIKHLEEIFHLSATSLKSPRNYLKLDTFLQSLEQEDSNHLLNKFKMQLLVWLVETQTGDLDEIKQKQRLGTYFDSLRHDGQLAATSLFAELDFVERLKQAISFSRVLVVNHAYLLERVEDDWVFLEGKILVVDEAQKLFLALESFSRRKLEILPILQWLEKESKQTVNLLQKRLLERLHRTLNTSIENFYKHQKNLLSKESLTLLRQDLSELTRPVPEDLYKILQPVFSDYWFESEQFADQRQTFLHAARKEFFSFKDLLPHSTKLYCISATLEISSNLSLADLLGFEEALLQRLEQEKTQKRVIWVDASMPDVTDSSDADYEREIAQRILFFKELELPMLVLFTAKKSMLAVSEILEESEVKHLCQDKNGTAFAVKKRFDRGDCSILLGTGSFWEGADFAKPDHMLVLLTRLPFANPTDIFMQKMEKNLLAQGKNPFNSYALPMASLRLKQALGRANRRSSQKASYILLDKRLVTKSYGKIMQGILEPDFDIRTQNFSEIRDEI